MINGEKRIEVGLGNDYFIFEKDWKVQEGLSKEQFTKKLKTLYDKHPDYDIVVTTNDCTGWIFQTVNEIVGREVYIPYSKNEKIWVQKDQTS